MYFGAFAKLSRNHNQFHFAIVWCIISAFPSRNSIAASARLFQRQPPRALMASMPLLHAQQHGNPPLPLPSSPSWSRKRPLPRTSASCSPASAGLTRCAPARPVDLALAGVDVAGDPLLGPSDYWAFGADMDLFADESNAVGGFGCCGGGL